MAIIIPTRKAAEMLGISQEAVTQAIRRGDIKAQKLGREWAVDRESVIKYKEIKESSKTGRYTKKS